MVTAHARTGSSTLRHSRPARRRRQWSLRTHAAVLVALFAATVAVNVIYQRSAAGHDARRAAIEDAHYGAVTAARILANDIKVVRWTVQSTAASASVGPLFAGGPGCRLQFGGTRGLRAGRLDVVTSEGAVVCSSLPSAPAMNDAGARWLRHALKAPTVVAPVVDDRTGRPSLLVTAPVPGRGVVAAFLDLEAVGPALADSFGGPRHLEFVLTTSKNVVLARSIDSAGWVGAQIGRNQLLPRRDGVDRRDFDGAWRIYGSATVAGVDWRLDAGANRADALAAAGRLARRQLLIALAALLVFLIAIMIVLRRTRRPISPRSAAVPAASAAAQAGSIPVWRPAEVATVATDVFELIDATERERKDGGVERSGERETGGGPSSARIFTPRRRTAIIVAVVGVPILAIVLGAGVLTDYLWFQEVGHADVYWRVQAFKVALLLCVGGAVSIVLLATLRTALRRAPSKVPRGPALAGAATCVVLGYAVGLHAMSQWQTVMLWTHRSSFGVLDPVHHRDVGFFVFTLPLLQAGTNLVLTAVAIAAALAAAVYTLSGGLLTAPLRTTAAARAHLAVLWAVALVGFAGRVSLMTYSLEISRAASGGAQDYPGAHYVDVRVRMPALQLIAVLLLLCAGATLVGAWLAAKGHARAGTRFAVWPLVATVGVAFMSLVVVPWVVQGLVVDPQPLRREQPQLLGAIRATRQAFALEDVAVSRETPLVRVPAATVARNAKMLANVQVWDNSVLLERVRQLSSGTPYFRASTTTLDVERVNGQPRLVVFAEQELDLHQASARARGWSNSRLAYTHGLGAVSFSASGIGPNAGPRLEPASPSPPRIYFGRQPAGAAAWVVVNTRRSEVDRPIPVQQPQATYHSSGGSGIALSNWVRRAAFAIRLGDPSLVISQDITPRSRIILRRDVIDRLQTLAGFLRWDPNTTAVEVGGRVVFLADGYTTSSSYPQSEPVDLGGSSVNYARASVRATVDAVSGDMRLYLSDQADPIARAWAAIFPGLFRPMSQFPPQLRAQLRYPPALFDAQAELYQRFHVQSASAYASGADEWARPTSV
ncbi:MAG: hypothetical protein JWL83_2616, partial [Actinomycetia bacterium]|nr:hypothetical protein [Actinomycetes bacterium]